MSVAAHGGGAGRGSDFSSEGDELGFSGSSNTSTASTTGSPAGGGTPAAAAAAAIAAGDGKDPLRLGNPNDMAVLASVGLGPKPNEQEVRTFFLALEGPFLRLSSFL